MGSEWWVLKVGFGGKNKDTEGNITNEMDEVAQLADDK